MRAAILVLFFLSVVFSLNFVHLLAESGGLFGYFLDFRRGESLHHVFVENPELLLEDLVLLLFKSFLALSIIGLLVSFVFQNLLLLLRKLLLLLLWKNVFLGKKSLNLLNGHIWILLEKLLLKCFNLSLLILIFHLLLLLHLGMMEHQLIECCLIKVVYVDSKTLG